MALSAAELLRDVGRLLARSHELQETLENLVRLVARWMRVGCCSIYLLEDEGSELVLRATRGLHKDAVGRVRLHVGKGIVGACLETRESIPVPDVRLDPRHVEFTGSGEERFLSLLAVPLVVRALPVGVLSVQTGRPRSFGGDEVELLETIASQVATIVLNARLLDRAFREGDVGEATTIPAPAPAPFPAGTVIRGLATAPGVAIGPIHLQPPRGDLAIDHYRPARSARSEWRATERALRETTRQISDIRAAVGERFGREFARVFTTHIMILEDDGFREKLRAQIFDHGNAARALHDTMREYMRIFTASKNPTIRERAADIEDVLRRAVGELLGVRQQNPPLGDGVIVVADQIAPSEFVLLETEKVAGLVTEHGGPTSHAAIFARSLEIPGVTGVSGFLARLRPSDRLIVDGIDSQLIVNPTDEMLAEYESKRDRFDRLRNRLDEFGNLPSQTRDGEEILLCGNVGGLNDIELIRRHGARGIGLFRTEILVLSSRGFPNEAEQVQIYREAAEALLPEWVTIRTFDLGGDKWVPGEIGREENPQLGWRSIRMLLARPEILETQLRAVVRANTGGNLRVMIPMLTSIEELEATSELLESVCAELSTAKAPPLGIMLETPAAIALADRLAPSVDFFSIGTNDLVQYTLAVDRENERVAASYDPFHPAVLMQIRRAARVAAEAGIPCSVCGELAGNPAAVPLLVGLGIREFSMAPVWVSLVREVVRATDSGRAEALARQAVASSRADDVRALVSSELEAMGLYRDADLEAALRPLVAARHVDSPSAGRIASRQPPMRRN